MRDRNEIRALGVLALGSAIAAEPRLLRGQPTRGSKHHFFGYIGHAGTIPWNRSGRFIVAPIDDQTRQFFLIRMTGVSPP